jgi:uncharacterized membrane protein
MPRAAVGDERCAPQIDTSAADQSCELHINHHLCTMETIVQVIDIDLPLPTVYNQWTRFEDFPFFMQGVSHVRQLDHQRVEWQVKLGGRNKTWEALIFEQEPDQCIAWRSISGVKTSGRVDFGALGEDCTRIYLHLNYEPEGIFEKTAAALGLVKARVASDLLRFKEFIEDAPALPDGWRGTIRESARNEDEVATTILHLHGA